MSFFLSIVFGIPIAFILLFFIIRYVNAIINTSSIILAIGLIITVLVIVFTIFSSWYDYTMNENFKDGVGGLICFIFIAISVWHTWFNNYSFLTFKTYEIDKPFLLQWIEGVLIVLVGGVLTSLIVSI